MCGLYEATSGSHVAPGLSDSEIIITGLSSQKFYVNHSYSFLKTTASKLLKCSELYYC